VEKGPTKERLRQAPANWASSLRFDHHREAARISLIDFRQNDLTLIENENQPNVVAFLKKSRISAAQSVDGTLFDQTRIIFVEPVPRSNSSAACVTAQEISV
jgi:hypothetical protein